MLLAVSAVWSQSSSVQENPLPVMFDNVKAYTKSGGVQVEWSNLTERDLIKYQVERSANGKDFAAIDEQLPKVNTNDRADYTSFDGAPLQGVNFYRIKVYEINGKLIFSKVLRIETGISKAGFSFYPNPVKSGQINVALAMVRQGQYNVRVINVSGQNVFQKTIVNQSSGVTQTLRLPASMKPGIYTMIINGDEFHESKLFIVE